MSTTKKSRMVQTSIYALTGESEPAPTNAPPKVRAQADLFARREAPTEGANKKTCTHSQGD